jgi:hypothetical protein
MTAHVHRIELKGESRRKKKLCRKTYLHNVPLIL